MSLKRLNWALENISPLPWKFDMGNREIETVPGRNVVADINLDVEDHFKRIGDDIADGSFISTACNMFPHFLDLVNDVEKFLKGEEIDLQESLDLLFSNHKGF